MTGGPGRVWSQARPAILSHLHISLFKELTSEGRKYHFVGSIIKIVTFCWLHYQDVVKMTCKYCIHFHNDLMCRNIHRQIREQTGFSIHLPGKLYTKDKNKQKLMSVIKVWTQVYTWLEFFSFLSLHLDWEWKRTVYYNTVYHNSYVLLGFSARQLRNNLWQSYLAYCQCCPPHQCWHPTCSVTVNIRACRGNKLHALASSHSCLYSWCPDKKNITTKHRPWIIWTLHVSHL